MVEVVRMMQAMQQKEGVKADVWLVISTSPCHTFSSLCWCNHAHRVNGPSMKARGGYMGEEARVCDRLARRITDEQHKTVAWGWDRGRKLPLRMEGSRDRVFGEWEVTMVSVEEGERQEGEEGEARGDLQEVEQRPSLMAVSESEAVEDGAETEGEEEQEGVEGVKVGQLVEVYWPLEGKWFKGRVAEQVDDNTWRVLYDDGDEYVELPRRDEWRLQARGAARMTAAGASGTTGEVGDGVKPAKRQKKAKTQNKSTSRRKGVMTVKGMVVMGMKIEVWFEGDAQWY
jgi:hypothetical protein